MFVNEIERVVPGNKPETEWIVLHTNGMSPEVPAWLEENFGAEWGRWFILNRTIYIREEKDYNWFCLRWLS